MSKWKVAFLHGLLLIFITYISLSAGYDYDYEDQKDTWGRCPWIRNRLKNGKVRIRSRGRIAKFTCKSGYELVGKKFATCVRGQWNNPVPVCIAKGCSKITGIANGVVTEKSKGAQLTFSCNPGYRLQGDASLFCDGSQWDERPPRCEADTSQSQKSCDFEDPDLCGWTHDPTHDFDWRRHQFTTPSGHVGTGPSYDHTFGEGKAGYYMYEEASAPRNPNDASRLFSPVYASNNSPGCFVFWYHMYGSSIGSLRIYIKPESHVFVELTPAWEKSGDQGNQWLRGNVTVQTLPENFQIVIEGIRGVSYLGDTAIDDVSLIKANCSSLDSFNATEGEIASVDSCRGRCHEEDNSTSCGCTVACETNNTCCSDYAKLCAENGSEPASGEDESVTGKLETEGTPEDKVGTEYTVTTPILSTVFITRSENQPTETENQEKSSTQVFTSISSTASPLTTGAGVNTSTAVATIPTPIVPDEQTAVSIKTTESKNITTQSTRKLTAVEITTVKTTIPITVLSSTTAKTPATEIPLAMATTVQKPLTISPQVSVDSTIPIASTSTISNLTIPVQIISTTAVPTSTTQINTTTGAATSTPTTSSTLTPKITTETTSTTTRTVPVVITVPAAGNTPTSKPTATETTFSESKKTTSLEPTTETTSTPTTSRVINTQTTGRIRVISTTASTNPPISTTVTKYTSVKTHTQPPPLVTRRTYPYRPTFRKITSRPTISTTLSTYFNNIRTTKTTKAGSFYYTAKIQATTADSLKSVAHDLKSETVVPTSNSSSVIGATVGVIIIVCLIVGVTFVFLRRRRQKLDKLHGDSIRFLPDNEVIEYSDASVTDSLFQSEQVMLEKW